MKHSQPWIVENEGIRPTRQLDCCFYCRQPKGSEHAPGCVIRQRTVVMQFTVELVMSEPEHWGAEKIEFHYNESSWCADNLSDYLQRIVKRMNDAGRCLCPHVNAEFIREATAEDENSQALFADRLPG